MRYLNREIIRFLVVLLVIIYFLSNNEFASAQTILKTYFNNSSIPFSTDTTNNYCTLNINVDSCRRATISVPSKYYNNADSIIVHIRDYLVNDETDSIHVLYCFPVGNYMLSKYIDYLFFPLVNEWGFAITLDLYFKDESYYY